MLNVIMPSVIMQIDMMLSVVMLIIVMLNVVANPVVKMQKTLLLPTNLGSIL